jgi:hypothetical protein
MHEQSIVCLEILPSILLGVSLYKFGNWNLSIFIPFLCLSVEFKRKTSQNEWFSFVNGFIK